MLDKKTVDLIKKDFPKESVQTKKSFKDPVTGQDQYLVGYKPQYVFERLNEVFGHDGWDYEVVSDGIDGKEAWAKGRLSIYKVLTDTPEGSYSRVLMTTVEQFGTGSYNKGTSLGDAKKSAATNALEKCASLKDIGHLAYKGLLEVPDSHPEAKNIKAGKAQANRSKLTSELSALCKEFKIDSKSFPTLTKNVLDKPLEASEISSISDEDVEKMIEFVKKNKGPF